MGYRCFLCGEEVKDNQNFISLWSKSPIDCINLIHQECYDLDDRNYLNRKQILKEFRKHKRR